MELEIKETPDTTVVFDTPKGVVMLTPSIGEDYFIFRVKLSDTQAVLGFEKFGTVGIGFAQEEDWNTNLPYTCSAQEILDHIRHNKGDDAISDDDVLEAIELVQAAARRFKERP